MLDKLISLAADAAERDGIAVDGEPLGAVHMWVMENISHRPEQTFFIVFVLTAELADREAQRQGFTNQLDRAAKLITTW